ncbi:MAG: hypothetical protein KatS3mg105_3895 [Gemmatales bacterium]|nr:MAG: hypothetical protein KatS3mg105_3895 [Gemmatales bacterium]
MAKKNGNITKIEMVRRAQQELGDATPTKIQEHIKRVFGETLKTNLISNYKGIIKAEEAGASGVLEVAPGSGKHKKSEVVRHLLRQLGPKASVADIQREAKKLGYNISAQLVYQIKAKSHSSQPAQAAGLSIADIEAVRDLTRRIGAETVKQLCDVLA